MNESPNLSEFDFPSPPPDPNSPERKRAAKYAVASKVCKTVSFVGAGILLVVSLLIEEGLNAAIGLILCLIPFIVFSILHKVFKNKELQIRCTKHTTGTCLYTVRHRSGKTYHRHPVVEYEVEGVTYTAELPVSCPKDSAGDLYSIYYDPLDPATVRSA